MQTYRRLLRYVYPHWPPVALALAAMAVQAVASGVIPWLTKDVIGRLDGTAPAALAGPAWRLPLLIVAVFVLRGAMDFVGVYGLTRVGRAVVRDLRAQLFDRYLAMPASLFDSSSSGALISKLTYDTEQVAEAISTSMATLVRDSLLIAVFIFDMLRMSWQLTVLTAVVGPAIGALLVLMSRAFRRYGARIQTSMGNVTRAAEQALLGHRVVKLFEGQAFEQAQFEKINRRNFKLNLRLVATRAAGDALTQYVAALAVAGVIFIAFSDWVLRDLSAAVFVGFLTAMAQLLAPLKRLVNINASMQKGVAGAESLFETLDGPVEQDTGTETLVRARGNVEFRDVSFGYRGRKGPVLEHVSISIPAGTTLALVGHSGSGKSTIASLLPRFYDVDAGAVLLDGTDVRRYRLRDLRRQLSLVSQERRAFRRHDREQHRLRRAGGVRARGRRARRRGRVRHRVRRIAARRARHARR